MDPRFQTSFIPKKPMTASSSRPTTSVSVFSLIATIFFIIALILTGGVFFYKQVLIRQIEKSKNDLESAKTAFEPEVVKELIRLDQRLESGKTILENHVAMTPLFDFLASVTLKSVRFKDFSFSYLASDKIKLEMKGQAQNYASVALQADLLNEQNYLRNTILTDMVLDPTGAISFNVSTIVDPSLISYSALVGANTAPAENIPAPATVTPSELPLEAQTQ